MKFFHLFIYLFLAFLLVSFAQQTEKTKIFEIMQMQEKAWNEGNLEKFMSGYWQSDSLKFIGKKGITWG
jgi:hypothetical protein